MNMSEAEKSWNYYQSLVKESGFEGITDLLAKHKALEQKVIQLEASEVRMREALEESFEALLPFAHCLQYIEVDEDDDEWAKFRLLIINYRDAAKAYEKNKTCLSSPPNTAELESFVAKARADERDKFNVVAYISEDAKLPLKDDGSYWLYPEVSNYRIPLYAKKG
jgi:hypothetical protein